MELTTLAAVKTFLGILDTTQDAKLTASITAASVAIRSYTGRDFAAPIVTGTKTYAYDRSGWLDIDDCFNITAVSMDGSLLTNNSTYTAGPDRGFTTPDGGSIYNWLELIPWIGMSPEMGFTRNLDMLWLYGGSFQNQYSAVAVTADFGWPVVPADVAQAAMIAATSFAAAANDLYNHIAISSYAVTKDPGTGQALSAQVKDLLSPYRRFV